MTMITDTFRSLPSFTGPTWVAIRYQITYPSLTFFHCHIGLVSHISSDVSQLSDKSLPKLHSYHLQAGMAVLLVEGLDVGHPEVPAQM
jgi:hypothetical protein